MVISEDQGLLMLRNANPVPETDREAADIDAALHLVAAEQRSSEVTQLSTQEQETPKPNRTYMGWLAAALVVVLVGVAILILNRGAEEAPPATEAVSTTVAESSTTVVESALSDIPVWMGSGNGQWTPARSKIPYAFTNDDNWNSFNLALTDERFSICPPAPGGDRASLCNLASVAVLFLDFETVDETREFLASFDGAELVDEQPVSIDGATGIRFEFTHEVPPLVGQTQGDLDVPVAATDGVSGQTPIGQGPLGRSVVSIVDVDGVIVTLSFQGFDVSRGGVEDAFATYRDDGLGIIDSIIWGNP
jgi:hypothetical protein